MSTLWRHKLTLNDLNWGKTVAVVDLVEVTQIIRGQILNIEIPDELSFGDFSVGRFAWKFENIRKFKNPFPTKGRQGLFDILDSVIEWQMLT